MERDIIQDIRVGLPFRGGYGLHLKFADDTVLFLEDNDTFGNVLSILLCYSLFRALF